MRRRKTTIEDVLTYGEICLRVFSHSQAVILIEDFRQLVVVDQQPLLLCCPLKGEQSRTQADRRILDHRVDNLLPSDAEADKGRCSVYNHERTEQGCTGWRQSWLQ